MEPVETRRAIPWDRLVPVILAMVALGISWMGIRWGLPSDLHHQSYHPDEEVIYRYSREIDLSKGDLTPNFYNYGTLYLTVLRVAGDTAATYGGVEEKAPWKAVGNAHFAGRLISSFCFAGLAVAVFFMARRLAGTFGGTFAGLVVAFSPALAVHSRFQTTDLLAVFLLSVGLLLAMRIADSAEEPTLKTWALAGLFVGLSAGTKYTGILGVLAILVAAFVAKRLDPKGLGASAGACFLGFVLGTPGFLLESDAFWRDFKYEMLHTSTGHGLLFEGVNGFAYTALNVVFMVGLFVPVIGLAGVAGVMGKRDHRIWPIIAFTIPYFLLIGRAEVLFARYAFPLIIVVALGFGWVMAQFHERGGWMRVGVVLGIFTLAGTLGISARFTSQMSGPEGRDVIVHVMRGAARPGDTVGLVSDPWYWSPPFFPDSTISRMPAGGMPGAIFGLTKMMEATEPPRPVRYVPENPNDRYDWDLRLIDELKPTYIVFSNFEVGPVSRLSARTDLVEIPKLLTDRFVAFHERLEQQYERVAWSFQDRKWVASPLVGATLAEKYASASSFPEDLAYVNPEVWVWRRKTP